MATTTQDVIINFVVNDTDLDSALKKLETAGKVDPATAQSFKQTNVELNKEAQALDKLASSYQKISSQFQNTSKNVIAAGIDDALKEAGVSATQFLKALQNAENQTKKTTTAMKGATLSASSLKDQVKAMAVPFKNLDAAMQETNNETDKAVQKQETLRKKLREVTVELQQLQLEGKQNTERYRELVALAGEYGDAIDEVNNQLRNSRDGEKTINSLVNAGQQLTQALAGASAATALLGDENQDLQETFAKLGLTMQVVSGLQALIVGLQTDGAITLALLNVQEKIYNAQLAIENALQSRSVIVRTAATVAQKALNLAMAANPLGIIITLLAAAIPLLLAYGRNTRAAAREQAALNGQLDRTTKGLEAYVTGLQNANNKLVAELEASGARQSQILSQQQQSERLIQEERIRQFIENQRIIENTRDKDSEEYKALLERQAVLEQEISQANVDGQIRGIELVAQRRREALEDNVKNIQAQVIAAEEGTRQQLNLQKQLLEAQKQLELNDSGQNIAARREIQARINQERLQLEADFLARRKQLEVKDLETKLINVQDDLDAEFSLRLQLLNRQTELELTNIKLSEDEKKAIRKRAFEEQIALQRDFNQRIQQQTIANEQSRIQAELKQRDLLEQEKLDLTIASIELQAAAEVVAANGNAAKIKEIYARRDQDIRNFKIQMINEAVEYEISLETARDGSNRRSLERIVANERNAIGQRIAALNALKDAEIQSIDLRLRGLQRAKDEGLISEREYTLQYEQLSDKRREVEEKNIEQLKQLRIANLKQIAETTINIFGQIGSLVQNINDLEQQRSEQLIEQRKTELDALLEAGAITEREAERRRKQIELQERQAKLRAAQQQKQQATFQALLAIPQAFLTGLTQGGIVVAAIYAALAAAQAAVIASRPIPRFFKGKKDRYEGLGEVGDRGPEFVQTKTGTTLYSKPTVIYLNPEDKVFTATETKMMLNKMPRANRYEAPTISTGPTKADIDYEKLGGVIAKHSPQTNINISTDFVERSVENGLSRVIYMGKRYKI